LEPAVEKFKQLFTDGILSLGDWDVQPVTRSNMMYIYHSTAMIIESQNAATYAESFAQGSGAELHEVAMMPFWTSDAEGSDYLYSIPSYFMAINKASADESEEKRELLLEVYDYLSSAEGQQALIGSTPQLSNVRSVPLEDSSFTEAIRDTIENGRVISTFYLAANENSKQVEKQLRSTTPDMINGTMSVTDWLLAADQVRDEFLAGSTADTVVYGQVDTTLTRLESAYTMADMYRTLSGADVGICYAGDWRNGTNGHFYAGDITDNSLACVRPDKEASGEEDAFAGTIVTATMTGSQILDILESTGDADTGYFVASGLTVQFDPWAAPGSRVVSCKLADGSDLDPDGSYQVAYYYDSLSSFNFIPDARLPGDWLENFQTWLESQGGTVTKPTMTLELVYE
jgi:hypothetical protein